MIGFDRSKGLIGYRRAVVPYYRDIRDRPTWELMDTVFYNLELTEEPGSPMDVMEFPNPPGIVFMRIMRALRKNPDGSYVTPWDGTKINVYGTNITSQNVTGTFNFQQDLMLTTTGNGAVIQGYTMKETCSNVFACDGYTVLNPNAIYAVTTATGPWVSATSMVVEQTDNTVPFGFPGAEFSIKIFRAYN